MKLSLFFAAAAATMILANCQSPQLLESRWRDRAITVDGSAVEWNGLIQYPHENQFGIGVVNDDTVLYLCMTSSDRALTEQVLRFGFTIWFQNSSGKAQRIGIHYPVGGGLKAAFLHGKENGQAAMQQELEATLQNLEIIGPSEKDSLFMKAKIAELFGIRARIAASNQELIYELALPLHADSVRPYALNLRKGAPLKITVETSEPDFELGGSGNHREASASSALEPAGRDANMMPGDHAGFSRGKHAGNRGGEETRERPPQEQFKLEFLVSLGQAPTQ
ncbi:MAG: hypothetical protein PHC61_17525 [Chitinivibrionales bacterium]|nr:hypothetical protein [Chitinivibrionales bacterium]